MLIQQFLQLCDLTRVENYFALAFMCSDAKIYK